MIVHRNRCPECNCAPSLMAGINTPGGAREETYLVCWKDRLVAKVSATIEWRKIAKPTWAKLTPYHWQMTVHGHLLDYWPTRRKWRYRNETHVGDVNAFLRRLDRRMKRN